MTKINKRDQDCDFRAVSPCFMSFLIKQTDVKDEIAEETFVMNYANKST